MLRGLTVLSFEQAVAGPFCTSKLCDQGARVIKIERSLVGDFARKYDNYALGSSSYFSWLNRGKESVVADIKDARDRNVLLRMIEQGKVDIFVQNLAPGACERAGFGSKTLRELNEKLITLDISGYGDLPRKRGYKAYDMLVAAEAGLCSVTGSPDAPGRVGVSICDITTGMNGYAAILQGLIHRQQTGKGIGYEVSLFDTVAEIMNVPYIQQKYTNKAPPRLGLSHPSIAPYGAFTTGDERTILISIQNEREWVNLCDHVLGKEYAKDPRFENAVKRVENRRDLDQLVAKSFASKTAQEMIQALLNAGIAFGELNPVKALVDNPEIRTISYETEFGHRISIPAPAILPAPKPSFEDSTVPKLGQHTEQFFKEFQQ